MVKIASDPGILDDINHGRVPVISWNCADDNTLGANGKPLDLYEIQQGQANSDLETIRGQLLQLKYPNGASYPVILRYFWEFNINASGGNNSNINGNGGCFASDEPYANAFIGAWDQIWNILSEPLPRPNVSFDFNPNVSDSSKDDVSYPDFKNYFPGPQYVDWIGADGYNKEDSNGNPIGFQAIFTPFYNEIAANPTDFAGIPLMIGETGSCQQYPSPNDQATFLQNVSTDMPLYFSEFQAVDYFDAPGMYAPPGGCNWSFNSAGLQEFKTLGSEGYFLPMVGQ